jgi:hypothetical protein
MLLQKEGRHAGGYAFPFCHIAVLSNINRSQIALGIRPRRRAGRRQRSLRARLNVCAWLFPFETMRDDRNTPEADGAVMAKLTQTGRGPGAPIATQRSCHRSMRLVSLGLLATADEVIG